MEPFVLNEAENKWLTALESGGYAQCRGAAMFSQNDYNSYCCLGVGAAIFGQAPEHTRHAVRVMETNGINFTDRGDRLCVEMNDTDNLSFQEIANRIRKNPETYFAR